MNILEVTNKIKDAIKGIVVDLGYADDSFEVVLEEPNDKSHGDYSTNTALRLAKTASMAPRAIAEKLLETIDTEDLGIEKLEIAGPGFLNIYLVKADFYSVIDQVLKEESNYGNSTFGTGLKVLLEYVSANPTGYLHIGHARGGAYGDALANIMKKTGFEVHREFYVNDGGNQINNLAKSIEARYFELLGEEFTMPENGYFGKEIISIAQDIVDTDGKKHLVGGFEYLKEYGVTFLLKGLREHLVAYRVEFDSWFRERDLYVPVGTSVIDKTVNYLREQNYTYHDDGAEWLKTSDFFDEKDRVIYTKDGRNTYIVPDIAYHKNKFDRGYDILIDVFGADHHGYMDRLRSAVEMVGEDSKKLEFEILQMVKVYQSGVEVKMSKRSGKAIGLQDLLEEVGPDPIRYFFAARALSSPMDLDLDLALRTTSENPVYYAQYAHARIVSVLSAAGDQPEVLEYNNLNENADDLLVLLSKYQSTLEECAKKRIPHKLTNYIQSLASAFHSYYNKEKFITDSAVETAEKLKLIKAVKIVLSDALNLIGVSSPERM